MEFVDELRQAVNGQKLPLANLAQRSGISRTSIQEIFGGRRLPSEAMVQRLAIGAGLDERARGRILRLWADAKTQMDRLPEQEVLFQDVTPRSRRSGSSQPVPQFGQPDPIRVSTPAELTQALKAVHIWAGEPSLRKLEARSGGRLRRSSVSDMLRGTTLPEYDRFIAFLRACGIEGSNLDVWVFTWRRLKALAKPEIASWMPGMWAAS
ncbi:helix-turn-helix domain-containing protein [Streptomyces canus]|uniref:helix-turn-helix domain-containing protein n=1 Tax=Streptomyces canus TaxID=58343 RepID=UPI00386F9456|nr:helix-turn-helix transcriptional regulator [Streptomyces canus]WSZ63845.1 helix-turn-helix transcriptional regulator [Streptomyces canus]